MQGELMPYVQGETKVPARDRQVARRAKETYDETRLAGYRVSGGMALAKHAMDETAALDAHRRRLAGDDPLLGMALLDIEAEAIQGAKSTIHRYHDDWNL
jgi:hypothetical protein